jgi:hypothetical protein
MDSARVDAEFRESFCAVLATLGGAASDALDRERISFPVRPAGFQAIGDGVEPAVEVVVHPAHSVFDASEHVRHLCWLRLRRRGHRARICRAQAEGKAVRPGLGGLDGPNRTPLASHILPTNFVQTTMNYASAPSASSPKTRMNTRFRPRSPT